MYLGVASNSQVKEDDLKLLILLPFPPEYLDCGMKTLHLVLLTVMVLPKALSKHSTS